MNCPYCGEKNIEHKGFNERICLACNLLWKGTREIYRETGDGTIMRGLQRIPEGTLIVKREDLEI